MNIVLTVSQGLILIVGLYVALRTLREAEGVSKTERRILVKIAELQALSTRVLALEAKHDSLLAQHRKLSGRFYAATAQPDLTEVQDSIGLHRTPDQRPPLAPSFCANYGRAQLDGPLSDAASCKCGYCEQMRDRRAAARAHHLPKSPGNRHDASATNE